MVEAAGVARLREYTWAIPPAHSRANFTPREIRKFTGGLVKLIRSHDVLRTEGVPQWMAELEWLPATPTAPVWDDVNKWLIERGHRYSVEGVRPVAELLEDLPPNLAVARELAPQLQFPEFPADKPGEEWRFYPTAVAPPVPESVAATISAHKSVPRWSAGWQLEFHGTSLYGVSSALAVGEILPSESDNSANGTACGRGAYTSQSHAMAARYGICHYFGEWNQPSHSHLVKMFLLVAIPGAAAEALPEAEWQQVDRTHLSKRGKKSAFQLTEDDARLKRVAMRLGEDGQGTVRERDWTTQAPGYSQATSSRAYVLGAVVGVLSPAAARRYGQEGKQAMVTTGWVEKAELPLARPRPLGRTP